MQAKVAVIGMVRFPSHRMPEARPHLKSLVEETRAKDGCLAFDVAEDLFEPGVVRFSELWPDEASLERHLEAAHIGAWLEAAKGCGVLGEDFVIYGISVGKSLADCGD
jgi:quinol monooxygenase YgiN